MKKSGIGIRRTMLNGGTGGARKNAAPARPRASVVKSPSIPNVAPVKPPAGGGRAPSTAHGKGYAKRTSPQTTKPRSLPAPPKQAPHVSGAPKRSI